MKIVFFDGVCNLCNEFVDFALSQKSSSMIFFAPLQGPTAKEKIPNTLADSVVFLDEDKIYIKSEAVFRLMQYWGGPFKIAAQIGLLAPKAISDSVYDLTASKRYSWFGKRDICRLPTKDESTHFLP